MSAMETDPIDLDELERLAKAATPGPWRMVALSSHYGVTHGDYRFPTVVYAHEGWDGYGNGSSRPNADYIAAANPATVLALIARVREAEANR